MTAARVGTVREYLLLVGFLLVCAAGVATVLLPDSQSEDPDAPAQGAASEAASAAPRP